MCYASGEPYGGTRHTDRKALWPESNFKKAMEELDSVVISYSRRLMSKEDDRLLTISAIAADLGQTMLGKFGASKAEYAAGLWVSELPRHLFISLP